MLLCRLIWEDTSGTAASLKYADDVAAQQRGASHVSHAEFAVT